MSSGREELLLMTPDPAVSSAVDAALRSNGRSWSRTTVQNVGELTLHIGRSSAPILVVDLEPLPVIVLEEMERISVQNPSVRIIALAKGFDEQLLMRAMQSGVRRLLLKGQIQSELSELLNRLTPVQAPIEADRGKIYVIMSAGGGCGASTLAANLAEELGANDGNPALLVDLDLAYGAIATMLGIEPTFGIEHVLFHEGAIDSHLLRTAASKFNDHVHVLPSPIGNGFSTLDIRNIGRIKQVLDAAATAYRNVVIDAPRLPADIASILALTCDRTLLTLQLIVKDVRIARAMLAALKDRGVDTQTILPLVMRYAKRQHLVAIEDAARALGDLKIEWIHSDYGNASRAMDMGKMLAEAAPRSPLRRDIQDLAVSLTEAAKRKK